MSSTATISSYEQARGVPRLGVPDGYGIAAYAFGSWMSTGRVWGLGRSREM